MDKVDISVVLPVFNERENVRPLLADLNEALAGTGKTFEIIFIDDGSTDGSVEKLTELQARKECWHFHLSKIRIFCFAKIF